jgi:hypothetical protein
LEKRPFLKRPFFPRKLPLKKGPFLKRPFFLNERGNFSVLFLQRQKKSTLEKRAVSETPLFPKKTALGKRAVSETPLFPNHDSMDYLQTVLYIHKPFAGSRIFPPDPLS